MQESIREDTNKQDDLESEKILAGFIASALDTEDRFAESMYVDYMKRDAWPAEMRAESFESIRSYLTVLIKVSSGAQNQPPMGASKPATLRQM